MTKPTEIIGNGLQKPCTELEEDETGVRVSHPKLGSSTFAIGEWEEVDGLMTRVRTPGVVTARDPRWNTGCCAPPLWRVYAAKDGRYLIHGKTLQEPRMM